jgi:hypothetical protein
MDKRNIGDRLLRMTHHLIIVNNCGKYLQNPFKDKFMDHTRWYTLKQTMLILNEQVRPWPSSRSLVVAHDTSSYLKKYLCKAFQIPLINDKVKDRTRKSDGRNLFLYPPFFFKQAGDSKTQNSKGKCFEPSLPETIQKQRIKAISMKYFHKTYKW